LYKVTEKGSCSSLNKQTKLSPPHKPFMAEISGRETTFLDTSIYKTTSFLNGEALKTLQNKLLQKKKKIIKITRKFNVLRNRFINYMYMQTVCLKEILILLKKKSVQFTIC